MPDKRKRTLKPCAHCGKLFTGIDIAIYGSNTCRQMAHQARHPDKYPPSKRSKK